MIYYVYEIKNVENGKIYVGAHATKNFDDNYMGSGKYLKNAQRKYGIDKFKKRIIEEFNSSEEMFAYERLIVNSDFIQRSDIYNIKEGGLGNNSNDIKELWKDPSYRSLVIKKSLSLLWTDPEHKAKLKAACQTKEFREKMSAIKKVSCNTDIWKKQNSKNSIEKWKRDGYRENIKTKTSEFMQGTKFVHNLKLCTNKRVHIREYEALIANGWLPGLNLAFSKRKKPQTVASSNQEQ